MDKSNVLPLLRLLPLHLLPLRLLPQNALSLIKEYCKPLSRSDWRKGTEHAKIFAQSIIFQDIKFVYVNKLSISPMFRYKTIFDKEGFDILFWDTFNKMIHKYGESLFNIYSTFEPNQMNFYRYCRLTARLKILKNKKIDIPTKMIIINL